MMDLSKQLLEVNERLERARNELQIVYQLADSMCGAIIQGNSDDMKKASLDYYDWTHAGETVYEECE